MKFVFALVTSKNKGRKRKTACRAMKIFLSAVMISCMLSAGGMNVYASEKTLELCTYYAEHTLDTVVYAAGISSAVTMIQNNLDFSSAPDSGVLDTDGYHWNASGRILELKNVSITGTVSLPDATVEIKTDGACTINTLAINGGSPQNTKLTFSGTGELTVENHINISGGNNNTLTVATGAKVTAEGGVTIGASGGVDSVVTVNGTLTAEGDSVDINGVTYYSSAVSAGSVIVGSGGQLNVFGHKGVSLNGMLNNTSVLDFTGVFTIQQYGCFTADCTEFNVSTESLSSISDNANQVFVIPENYLPTDCDIKKSDTGKKVDFVRKDTGEVYVGPMTIHEIHDWSDDWYRDETSHWKECRFNGCGRRKDEGPHSYDSETRTCICGAKLDVAFKDTEEMVYNGQEHRPGVTVKVDDTELDVSKYNAIYSDNINAGEASVAITGKGDLHFEWTVKFQIAKATPTITWNTNSQNIIYTGSQVAINRPSVVLAGGEEFNEEINYFYKSNNSANYIPGLPANAGEYSVKAAIKEQSNYISVESTDLMLTVEKAQNAPNMPSDTMNVKWECEKVSDVKLPEKWQWKEADQNSILMIDDPTTATAVYVGEDQGNYNNETIVVTIIRADCDHTYTELKNEVAATCQEQGYSGDTYCRDCGMKISSGEVIPVTEHEWGIVGEEGATATSEGKRIYACSKCGATREEVILRLEGDVPINTTTVPENEGDVPKSPQTGQPMMPWWNMLIGSLTVIICMGVLSVAKKKEERGR